MTERKLTIKHTELLPATDDDDDDVVFVSKPVDGKGSGVQSARPRPETKKKKPAPKPLNDAERDDSDDLSWTGIASIGHSGGGGGGGSGKMDPRDPRGPWGAFNVVAKMQVKEANRKKNVMEAEKREAAWVKLPVTEKLLYAKITSAVNFSLTNFPPNAIWHFKYFNSTHFPDNKPALTFVHRGRSNENDYILTIKYWKCDWCFGPTEKTKHLIAHCDLYDLKPTRSPEEDMTVPVNPVITETNRQRVMARFAAVVGSEEYATDPAAVKKQLAEHPKTSDDLVVHYAIDEFGSMINEFI
jgi:hypothetical protein